MNTEFGTIAGKHTVTETRDLLSVADYRFRETFKAFDALQEKPADLTTDVGNLARKWQKERGEIIADLVKKVALSFPTPPQLILAEDDYSKVLSFVQYGETTKGSLQDITYRIEQLQGKKILYENQPSQTEQDFDLSIYKDLDSAIKQGESAASAASKKAGEIATSNWPLIIGGTVLATLGVSAYLKR